MKIKFLLIVISTLILQSCYLYKIPKLVKNGEVQNTDYLQETSFNYYNNLIFVEVEINGNKYNFIYDTGAEANVIGKHIIDEIDYKIVSSAKVNATQKSKNRVEFIEIPKISIASVDFENTGAIVVDISHFDKQFGCNKIDGIIGNNLMRKATWQIDYQNQKITVADNIEKLNIAENAIEIAMNAGKIRNVFIDLTIDSVPGRFTFDSGYNGYIQADSSFFKLLLAKNNNMDFVTDKGISVNDLHGAVEGTTYNALVKNINMEGIELNNKIISLSGKNKYVLGNEFYQNYVMTVDWGNDKIYLAPVNEIIADTLRGFEVAYSPNFIAKKIEFTRFRVEHALEENISLNAEILKINDLDVSNFTLGELCAYAENDETRNNEVITLTVLDKGVTKTILLNKKILLPK